MAKEFASEMAGEGSTSADDLLRDLRQDLRQELMLERVSGDIKYLRVPVPLERIDRWRRVEAQPHRH